VFGSDARGVRGGQVRCLHTANARATLPLVNQEALALLGCPQIRPGKPAFRPFVRLLDLTRREESRQQESASFPCRMESRLQAEESQRLWPRNGKQIAGASTTWCRTESRLQVANRRRHEPGDLVEVRTEWKAGCRGRTL